MKFIHLSDLHIHSNAIDNQEVMVTLNHILKKYPGHHIIITGDITDDGSVKQYEQALALLRPFEGRIFICPGNHDFGASGNFYSHERALRFDEMLVTPLHQGGTFKGDNTPVVNLLQEDGITIMLIALDSNLETQNAFDFACGEIGDSQLDSLYTLLSTADPGTRKIVFFHHHPFMVNNPFMELKDAQLLARTLYGKADVILFGHKHEMKQWENRWGSKYMLASDNSPGKNYAKEISIDISKILVAPVPVA